MPQNAKERAVGALSQILHARYPTHVFTSLPHVGRNGSVSSPSGGQISFEITGPSDQAPVVHARASRGSTDDYHVYRAAEDPSTLVNTEVVPALDALQADGARPKRQ
ncbi:MAG: hypothetical protein ACHQC8_02020 [Solirubrobacterales bacterium]